MDNPLIDRINKTFKNKKLTWCGNFLTVGDPDLELEKGVCYDFTFQINKIKPMISIGNWTDFALVDVTLYVKEDTILGRLVSGEYSKIFSGDNSELIRFYTLKNNTAKKIRETLKLVSDLDVVVESIKPILVSNEKNIEPIMEQKTNRSVIRDIIRNILFEVKNDMKTKRRVHIGEYDFGLDESVDVILSVNTFNKNVEPSQYLKPLDVEGYWDDELNVLEIEIDLEKNIGKNVIYDLIGELNDVVTHEVEHIKQTKHGYEFPDKKYKRKINYYKQPHEIEAQIAGFKRKAKLQGRPVEDVIRDFFEKRKEMLNISDKVINRMVLLLLSQII
jgi:hypothetical protein